MTKIRCLQARAVRVPMPTPHRTASGVVSESPLVLTDIVTDAGATGRSITFTYTAAALGPTADLIRNIEPLIQGEELAPAEIAQKLARRFRLLGTQGLVGMALAGIDMALWDALARLHETPLCRLLGGVEKPTPAYGAVGHDGEVESARVAEDWATRGFRGVKVKIGYPTVAEDVRVIRAIRSGVGPDVAIMVDYNQSLTPTDAIDRMRALDAEGLTWVEEPVLATDYPGLAQVAREARTPIQAGENWWGPEELRHAIDARSTDYVMLDVMKIGGVTGWQRASALAGAAGLRVSSHLWTELSAQLLAATPTANWLEYCDWWNPVVREPLAVENGLAIPGPPIEWRDPA
jgi:mandelate racemase